MSSVEAFSSERVNSLSALPGFVSWVSRSYSHNGMYAECGPEMPDVSKVSTVPLATILILSGRPVIETSSTKLPNWSV